MPINSVRSCGYSHFANFQSFSPTEKPYQPILDCFETTRIPQKIEYEFLSLKDLYEQKDSLRNLNASQLIHFWNNVGNPETSFFDRFNSKTPEEYRSEIIPKLCEEITDRFLTGRGLKSEEGLHLLCIMNDQLKSHIINKIFEDDDKALERYAKAKQSGIRLRAVEEIQLIIPYIFDQTDKIIERYQKAKHLKIDVDPAFAMDLFRSKNLEDILRFFREIQRQGIEHQHLFLMPRSNQNFLHQLFQENTHSYESIAHITMIAEDRGINIEALLHQKDFFGKTPLQYAKNPSLFQKNLEKIATDKKNNSYIELLKEFQIDPQLDVLQSYKQLQSQIPLSHKQYVFFMNLDLISMRLEHIDLSIFSNTEIIHSPALLKLYLHIRAPTDHRIYEFYDEAEKSELSNILALLKHHLPEMTPEVEYLRILKSLNIPEEHHKTKRGYRLAALHLHPDKTGPSGETRFKRFMNLAEELGYK